MSDECGAPHLISQLALDALLTESQTTESLETVGSMSLSDVRIFVVMGKNTPSVDVPMKEIVGRTKNIYAEHFRNIQRTVGCKLAITCIHEAGLHVGMLGYVSYYTYALGDETIYVYYHETLSQIVLLCASTAPACAAACRFVKATGLVLPFGKLCSYCGNRTWCGQGEAKNKKCPCKKVRYCSKDCQVAHWPAHRTKCAYDKWRREEA